MSKYAVDCANEGMEFCPLAFHCWGGFGPLSSSLVNRLIKQVAGDSQGWRKIMVGDAIRHALGSTLMKAMALQLSSACDVHPVWTLPPVSMAELLCDACGPAMDPGPFATPCHPAGVLPQP